MQFTAYRAFGTTTQPSMTQRGATRRAEAGRYICIYIYIYIYYVCVYVHIYTYIYVYICIYVYIYIICFIVVYIYIYNYTYIYIYIYIYIHTHLYRYRLPGRSRGSAGMRVGRSRDSGRRGSSWTAGLRAPQAA